MRRRGRSVSKGISTRLAGSRYSTHSASPVRERRIADRGVARADPPRDRQQAGLDFVNRAGCRRQDIGLGGLRARQHLRRCGIERDLLPRAKAGEIDDADGVSVPIGDEAVAEEALRLRSGARRGGSGGQPAARAATVRGRFTLLF